MPLPTEMMLLPLRLLELLGVLRKPVPPTEAPATASNDAAPNDDGESIGVVLVEERENSPLVLLEPEL